MLYLITGTDTEKARAKLNAAIEKVAKKATIIRITDAHATADLEAALQGGGMFGGAPVVVLDNVFANEELRTIVIARLPTLAKSADHVFMYESAPDAATRKQLEKYAETAERFDAAKSMKKDNFFALANYLQQGKKKELWVTYQREILAGKAPEAIHGILFYGAKQSLMRNPRDQKSRARVAVLAELPHQARRQGMELEYALEHFVLSGA